MHLRFGFVSFVTATSLGLFVAFGSWIPPAIEPAALWNELGSQASGWVVLDIRPAWQFAEFHVPEARNVSADDLPAAIAGAGASTKIVVVDRDGTAAWAAAGAAMASHGIAKADVRVLAGGTLRWWNEIELKTTPAAATTATKPKSASQPAKPRSSGC